jgi:hypothetical protein
MANFCKLSFRKKQISPPVSVAMVAIWMPGAGCPISKITQTHKIKNYNKKIAR